MPHLTAEPIEAPTHRLVPASCECPCHAYAHTEGLGFLYRGTDEPAWIPCTCEHAEHAEAA